MQKSLLVLGGNGYVGSHICKAALNSKQWNVLSLSRSGKPPTSEENWTSSVNWCKGDLLQKDDTKVQEVFNKADAVISTIGAFATTNARMEALNGDTNINAINYSVNNPSISTFCYVSSARVPSEEDVSPYMPVHGYFNGKKRAETHLQSVFKNRKVILRPGFVHGTRSTSHGINIPLSIPGIPMEKLGQMTFIQSIPIIGFDLASVISVSDLSAAAIKAVSSEEKEALMILDSNGMRKKCLQE